MEVCDFFRSIVNLLLDDASMIVLNQIIAGDLNYSIRHHKHVLWMDGKWRFGRIESIGTRLQDTPQFALLEIFFFFGSSNDLILKSDRGILIYGIDFVRIGAKVIELLSRYLDKIEPIFLRFLFLQFLEPLKFFVKFVFIDKSDFLKKESILMVRILKNNAIIFLSNFSILLEHGFDGLVVGGWVTITHFKNNDFIIIWLNVQ